MILNYSPSGHIVISAQDDCHAIVDAMLATDYNEEFCLAVDFSPDFVSALMEAGFLVMSINLEEKPEAEPFYILLPKLHLVRSALFFENLHIKKSIRRFLNKYELRTDSDFDYIIDRCVEKHGADWLTPPLVSCIKKIRQESQAKVYPTSFALYRDERLVAGEFGVICGKVYTSYSGYYDENNSGTVQIILAARFLQEQGFSFFDLGMPLDYKNDLGAVDISPNEFVKLFRGSASTL